MSEFPAQKVRDPSFDEADAEVPGFLEEAWRDPSKAVSCTGSADGSPHSESTRDTAASDAWATDDAPVESASALDDIEAALDLVRELCAQARLFDAMDAVQKLEEALASTPRSGATEARVAAELARDATLASLRSTHARMRAMLATFGPEALPQGEQDSRWARATIRDAEIGEAFSADIRLRFASGGERDPKGPSTQLISCGHLSSFPMDLDKFLAVYRETDLYKREWMQDCERCGGRVAGVEQMYSSLSHIVNASPILPVKIDILTVREFAVLHGASPIGDLGSGVLVVDASPPVDAASYAGWNLPPQAARSTRLSGILMLMYLMPTPGRPGHCDAFVVARCGASIPQWLVPLSLLKKFMANHYVSVFKSTKLKVQDDWEALSYKERIANCTPFYGSVQRVGAAGGRGERPAGCSTPGAPPARG